MAPQHLLLVHSSRTRLITDVRPPCLPAQSFRRSFTLPDDAKEDDIEAHMDRGVLTVVVKKEEQPKRPEVSAAYTILSPPAGPVHGEHHPSMPGSEVQQKQFMHLDIGVR